MTQDLSSQRVFEIGNAFWSSQILLTAVKLKIFDLLEKKPLTHPEVSDHLGASLRGVELLLNALVALGFLEKAEGKYHNTPLSSSFLVGGKRRYKGYSLLHLKDMWEAWGNLEEAVLTGKPLVAVRRKFEDEGYSGNFTRAMHNNAVEMTDPVAHAIGIEKHYAMLDIGGGSATYSIAFAKKNKNLTVTLIDLPPVLKITREMITENRLTKRFHLIGGDFFKVDFGSGYDLVYISHIIHQNGGNENLMLAKKAYQSLHEGGEIVLHDFFLDDSGTAPLFSATFALNMLVHTETGRSYKFSEVEDWLTEAGFTGIRKAFLEAPSSLLVATKCNAIR